MGQKNVVIDWDLPTFEERLLKDNPAVAEAAEAEARHEMYQWLYVRIVDIDTRLRRGIHTRDCYGRLIEHFDQWLLAAERGEWP